MKQKDIEEIVKCLPAGKTHFYYFKDRYALLILSYFVGKGKKKGEINGSPYKRLLAKPAVRQVLANCGYGLLTGDMLNSFWPKETECYLLTLGQWGSKNKAYDQTSRRGYNLVLQLNFSSKHNRPYYNLIKPKEKHPFEYKYHPIARKGYHTLAWARIDMNIEDGEALIEEIQNDWIRLAVLGKATIEEVGDDERYPYRVRQRQLQGVVLSKDLMKKYIEDILKPHMSLWEEAMLSSTIWFLREEIGIRRIFYHTYDSGLKLKGMSGSHPPKSIYTTLPKKFCFQETDEMPLFLSRHLKKTKGKMKEDRHTFYLMDIYIY